jgi:hypothetical protein
LVTIHHTSHDWNGFRALKAVSVKVDDGLRPRPSLFVRDHTQTGPAGRFDVAQKKSPSRALSLTAYLFVQQPVKVKLVVNRS